MNKTHCLVTLMPGDFYFGDKAVRIRTLLGSCVAIVVWHPKTKLAGMCHYVLPKRGVLPERRPLSGAKLDGRYANEAVQLFAREMARYGTRPSEYQVSLYGAANMFRNYAGSCADDGGRSQTACEGCMSVACRNRIAAYMESGLLRLNVVEVDLGGCAHRLIELDALSGKTTVNTTTDYS